MCAGGKCCPFCISPSLWSYRPIRCSNGFRSHHQNYSSTASPSRHWWDRAGTGRYRPKPLCAKGKGFPFALSPPHWSYRSLRCVRGTKFPSRPGRAICSDARAVLNRHPLISTRRAPCAARRACSEWAKRDREHVALSIPASCTWRAKYGLPDWTLGLYDFYNRFTWVRELSLLQRQLREHLPTKHNYRRWGSRVLCR